jgi:hypothetical protein
MGVNTSVTLKPGKPLSTAKVALSAWLKSANSVL